MTPRTEPHHVVILGVAPVIGYDLTIPAQIFGMAADEQDRPLYRVAVASVDGGPLATNLGLAILPEHGPEVLARAGTVIIPGTRAESPRRKGILDPALRSTLELVRPSARVMSICTGAFVLAAAGWLDGCRATTHWEHAAELAALHPDLAVDPEVLFLDETTPDGRRVLTSAGLSAGVDLCLHVLRGDHGSEVANRAARHLVVPPWRDGGQAQYIERAVPDADDGGTAEVREWLLDRLAEPVALAAMAARARMSVRTFSRRFREETGQTPGQWLTQQRLRHATQLLEQTAWPVDRVAAESGLGTGASLRQRLRASHGVSPQAYRRTFRGQLG